MYTITMTVEPARNENYWARDDQHVLDYALDYTIDHGDFSGMEDWDFDNVRQWIENEVERLSREEIDVIELYVGGPKDHHFLVRRES